MPFKRKPKKLTTADIGAPFNFKHVAHVGFDALKLSPKINGLSDNQRQIQGFPAFTHDSNQIKNVFEVTSEQVNETTTPDHAEVFPQGENSIHETLAELLRKIETMAQENLKMNQKLQLLEKNIAMNQGSSSSN